MLFRSVADEGLTADAAVGGADQEDGGAAVLVHRLIAALGEAGAVPLGVLLLVGGTCILNNFV